ncbi:hypothetical protein [Treponema sp. R80B11-R83G3]
MKIAIDFDGTCVTHEYPEIGKDIGAVRVLKKLVAANHLLILNTMRSGVELQEAVNWFKENDIPLYGVNQDPEQKKWTQSPKVHADLYIDDAALGCPLIQERGNSSYADWAAIEKILFPDAKDGRTCTTCNKFDSCWDVIGDKTGMN